MLSSHCWPKSSIILMGNTYQLSFSCLKLYSYRFCYLRVSGLLASPGILLHYLKRVHLLASGTDFHCKTVAGIYFNEYYGSLGLFGLSWDSSWAFYKPRVA